MFWSKAIEVAVGLALVYLLLSLVCTIATEWIAAILALRASTLREGIDSLLTSAATPGGDKQGKVDLEQLSTLTEKLYNHPLT